jgi:CRISPR system Cascade subunit CasE
MYFSRIRIDESNLDIHQWVTLSRDNLYTVHQLLWKLFKNEVQRNFLFHEERRKKSLKENCLIDRQRFPVFYVVSSQPPQSLPGIFLVETKIYDPALSIGQRFKFTLRANPVVTVRCEGRKNSKHHDILMHEKYKSRKPNDEKSNTEEIFSNMRKAAMDWFLKRAPQCGFSAEDSQINVEGYQHHRLNKKSQKDPIEFSTIDYSGILTIENPEQFKRTLFEGIGRAKAFGCGLMLIRPQVS